ncbi:MAG: hypothetical protein HY675_24185 [Chloroflexi bacterium]|nr:hypothetical protein [Chloroflexota bacterium]
MRRKNSVRVGFAGLALMLAASLALIACAQAPATAPAPSKAESPKSTSPSGQAKPAETKPAPATEAKPTTAAKPGPTPQYGGVLRILSAWPPQQFGYPPSIVGISSAAAYPGVDAIVGMDNQGQATSKLATAWEIGKDGKSITFTLRKGVKFHDGTLFDATAAKWNLDGVKKANMEKTENWTSVDVVDDNTVRINLSEFDNGIMPALARTIGLMVSPTAFEKNGKDWAVWHPVGAGPFKFVSFERNVSVKYERFDDYWGGKPYLDGVEIRYVTDPMVQSAGIQAGEGQVIFRATTKVAADLRTRGFEVVAGGQGGVLHTNLDVLLPDTANADSIFAKKGVREAIDYAIDKKAIAKAVGLGVWEAASQMVPRGYAGFSTSLEGRTYNPDRAKQLLAAAGYPDGFKTRIIAPNTAERDMLVAIQSNLKAVGIDAQLEIVPRAKYDEYDLKGWNGGLLYMVMALEPNAGNILARMMGSPSQRFASLARPSEWVESLKGSRTTADMAVFKTLMDKAIKFAYEDALAVPLFESSLPYVVSPKVHDAGFLTRGFQLLWTPEKAWLSK